jgi:hypothetical protein
MVSSQAYNYALIIPWLTGGTGGAPLYFLIVASYSRPFFSSEKLNYYRESKSGISALSYWLAKNVHLTLLLPILTTAFTVACFLFTVPLQPCASPPRPTNGGWACICLLHAFRPDNERLNSRHGSCWLLLQVWAFLCVLSFSRMVLERGRFASRSCSQWRPTHHAHSHFLATIRAYSGRLSAHWHHGARVAMVALDGWSLAPSSPIRSRDHVFATAYSELHSD